MRLKSYLADSLRMAIEVSKASVIKKNLITKYHKFYFHIDSQKDVGNVSKFHRPDDLIEKSSMEKNVVSQFLNRSEKQLQDEASEEINFTPIEKSQTADIPDLPSGSIVVRIITRKGLIVEKNYQTPTGSNISIFF